MLVYRPERISHCSTTFLRTPLKRSMKYFTSGRCGGSAATTTSTGGSSTSSEMRTVAGAGSMGVSGGTSSRGTNEGVVLFHVCRTGG